MLTFFGSKNDIVLRCLGMSSWLLAAGGSRYQLKIQAKGVEKVTKPTPSWGQVECLGQRAAKISDGSSQRSGSG